MTFYDLSIITNTGFPYYHLVLKKTPKGENLFLRFFDFSKDTLETKIQLDPTSSFELNAGLVSALFEFARNINKKIEILEFTTDKESKNFSEERSSYKGDVLITTQTESYLLHKSVKEKIKLIYNLIIAEKVPLDSALEILQNEVDKITEILTDSEARKRVKNRKKDISQLGNELLTEMKDYGLKGICITSFDLSPITTFGNKYELKDIDIILRNIRLFPEISALEWDFRQSNFGDEKIWVYIVKSGVGPTVNGLFQPYFYLLIADPLSYLGEFPGKLAMKFNQILG
ncbi:MAG: hypothetical protein ACFE85_04565 [Candidatus Hodarchaeota archaeon]